MKVVIIVVVFTHDCDVRSTTTVVVTGKTGSNGSGSTGGGGSGISGGGNNQQLMNEAEYLMKNYGDRGGSYPSGP